VGLDTATGEGWGLVAFEHGATGAAQVMPDHSACAELWPDKAMLVPVEGGRDEDGVVSRDGVVAALERLYADPGLRARLGDAARAHALDPRFHWDTIAQSWKTLLEREAGRVRSSRAGDVRTMRG
jgi:glycosyltransferase involved in cell wall biosynthesis